MDKVDHAAMASVRINPSNGIALHDQFAPVYQALKAGSVSSDTVFDLSVLPFACPLTILPIASLIHEVGCGYLLPTNAKVSGYLGTVSFPHGVSSDTHDRGMTHIPIGRLSIGDTAANERLISEFGQLVLNQLGTLPLGATNGIRYPIDEMTTNIFDHSKKDTGWMFGQYFPTKKYLDVCILDRGRGFRGCYKEELNMEVDDAKAVELALRGYSSKKTNERGFGLWTTKRMVVEGLGGQCFILSGSAGYLAMPGREQAFTLNDVGWNGVIVAFRIPDITTPFDHTQYLE